MDEPLVPGAYTATENMNIRSQMKTDTDANLVGRFTNGEPFTVYEVYPEQNGIVWGRVSSNVGGGQLRFVGLRVNNHPKARLSQAAEPEPPKRDSLAELTQAIRDNTSALTLLTTAVRDMAKK